MSLLAVPIIAIAALVISILCLVIFTVVLTRYKTKFAVFESQSQTHELLVNSLQEANNKLQVSLNQLATQQEKSANENTLVSKQLEHRIKTLQSELNTQQDLVSQLQTDQGEDKFYARAIKLAKKGADIDEIVTECELPPAEVEMLISVYQNKP